MAVLAWAYVATRIIHTLIHTGSNRMARRAIVFAAGVACLFFMWIGVVISVV